MSKFKIIGTYTGLTNNVAGKIQSAIIKHPESILTIRKHSIDHDEVANELYHGGDMRVVHHYSMKNYNYLKKTFPDIAERFVPGSFGENIVTEELTESELNIGDIYMMGTAKVQLTVSRIPCSTLNYAYNDNRILKEVLRTGRTGWFYRVLEEGLAKTGDYLELIERPFPDLPVSRLYDQGFGKNPYSDLKFLKRCLDTGLMDKGWRPKIQKAISGEQDN